MQNLINLLTNDQIKIAKAGRLVWMTNAAQRKIVVAACFDVEIMDKRNSHLGYGIAKELAQLLNEHGKAANLVSICNKYDDSIGAYEVATVSDEDGKEFTVTNSYDYSICFRNMTAQQVIDYANK